MDNKPNHNRDDTEAILAFDTLYTTNHMKILKVLLPYLSCEYQKKLAVFIKWQELTFTLQYTQKYSSPLYCKCCSPQKEIDPGTIAQLLSPYCSDQERKILSYFSEFKNVRSIFSQIQDYLPVIQELMSSNEGDSNLMNMVEGMLSDEQKNMFQMFMENERLQNE